MNRRDFLKRIASLPLLSLIGVKLFPESVEGTPVDIPELDIPVSTQEFSTLIRESRTEVARSFGLTPFEFKQLSPDEQTEIEAFVQLRSQTENFEQRYRASKDSATIFYFDTDTLKWVEVKTGFIEPGKAI